jgi:hypothetical protein
MHDVAIQVFANLILQIFTLIAPFIALAIAGYAVRVLHKLGVCQDARSQLLMRKMLSDMLDTGAENIAHYAETEVAQHGPIKVQNPKVAALANLVITQAPKQLKKLGLNPNTPEGQKAIIQLVTAHLPPSDETNSVAIAAK